MNIALEILQTLKGRRSSQKFSTDLGYKTNQVHRWQTEHSILTWDDFLKVCIKSKIPFQENLYKNTVLQRPLKDLKSLFADYFPHISRTDFAKEMKVSPATVTKWFSGKSSPPAGQIFDFFKNKSITSFATFVGAFLPEKAKLTPVLSQIINSAPAYASAYQKYPWFDAVVGLIRMPHFANLKKPLAEKLANHFQIDASEAQEIVQILQKYQAIRLTHDGGYEFLRLPEIDLSSSPDILRQTINFWTQYHQHRISNPEYANKGSASYINFSVTEDQLDEVRKLILNLINSFANLSKPEEGTRHFNYTMFLSDANLPFLTKIR